MEHYIRCARKSLEDELSKKLTVETSGEGDNELEELKKELEELRSSTENEETKLTVFTKRAKQVSVSLNGDVMKIGADVSTIIQENSRGAAEISLLKAKLNGIRESYNCIGRRKETDDTLSSFAAQLMKLRQEVLTATNSAKEVVRNNVDAISTEDWRVRIQELKEIIDSISTSETDANLLSRELDSIRVANGALADELESMYLKFGKMDRDFNQNCVDFSKKELVCKALKENVAGLEAEIVTLSKQREGLLREKVLSADKKAALLLTYQEVERDIKKTELELDSRMNQLAVLRDRSSHFSSALNKQNNLTDLTTKIAKGRLVQLLRHQLADLIGSMKITEEELLASIAQLKGDILEESKSLNSKIDTAHELENCRLAKVEAVQSECDHLKAVIFSHEELSSYGEIKKSQLQDASNAQYADIARKKEQIDHLEKALTLAKSVATAKPNNNKDKKAMKRKQDTSAKKDIKKGRQKRTAMEATVPEVIDILDDTVHELSIKEDIYSKETTSVAAKEAVLTDKDLFMDDSSDFSVQSSEDDEEFGNRFGPSQVIQATPSIDQMSDSQYKQPINDSLLASDVDSDNDDDFFGKAGHPARTLDNTFDADAHRIVTSTPILQKRREKSPEVRNQLIGKTSKNKRATRKNNPVTTLPTRSGRKRATRKAL